jgi:hypothetical protein
MTVGIVLTFGGKCLPDKWHYVNRGANGATYAHKTDRISVIESIAIEQDGKRWQHVSLARPDRLPDYDDLTFVKRHWIGEDKYAYQVFPPKAKHVNIHPNCLHLFSCLDGDAVLPDFTRGGNTI